jgi:FeS assembly protein IscX
MEAKLSDSLNWEASYALARELRLRHPSVDLVEVSLEMVFNWVLAIPGFDDDPELANEEVLLDIYQDWLEETLEREFPSRDPGE